MVPRWVWAFDDARRRVAEPVARYSDPVRRRGVAWRAWRTISREGVRTARLLHDGEPATGSRRPSRLTGRPSQSSKASATHRLRCVAAMTRSGRGIARRVIADLSGSRRAPRPDVLSVCSAEAPMIAAATLSFWSTHASGRQGEGRGRRRRTKRCTSSTAWSSTRRDQFLPLFSSVARPGGRALARLVPVSTPCATGENDLGDTDLARGTTSPRSRGRARSTAAGTTRRGCAAPSRAPLPRGSARPSTRSPRCRGPCPGARRRRTRPSSPRAGSRCRSGAPGTGRRSPCRGGAATRRSTP